MRAQIWKSTLTCRRVYHIASAQDLDSATTQGRKSQLILWATFIAIEEKNKIINIVLLDDKLR